MLPKISRAPTRPRPSDKGSPPFNPSGCSMATVIGKRSLSRSWLPFVLRLLNERDEAMAAVVAACCSRASRPRVGSSISALVRNTQIRHVISTGRRGAASHPRYVKQTSSLCYRFVSPKYGRILFCCERHVSDRLSGVRMASEICALTSSGPDGSPETVSEKMVIVTLVGNVVVATSPSSTIIETKRRLARNVNVLSLTSKRRRRCSPK